MLTQNEAERGLVYSLLRRPGEDAYSALERVATLPVAIEPEDIADAALRGLLATILENATNEVATSTKLAAQATGIDEFDLVQGVESIDPAALVVYARAVEFHSLRRVVDMAAAESVEDARTLTPEEALARIDERFASITTPTEEDRIATISERVAEGRQLLVKRQASMTNGEVRVSFPLPGLDTMLPYLLPGQMILITGQTKVGKSSFAAQLYDANIKRGLHGLYFHFEDTPEVMDLRRIARQMAGLKEYGVPLKAMLSDVLTVEQWERIEAVRNDILEWGDRGIEVYAAGWTMEQVVRVWRRQCTKGIATGHPIDFVVVDYLNKAELTSKKLNDYGLFGARGRDAELVKQTAESTGVVTFLVQQEGAGGTPYETKQSAQKSQAWISLVRERDENTHALHEVGQAIVKNANMGSTGAVYAQFLPNWMLWMER
jgi:hypothetical protein